MGLFKITRKAIKTNTKTSGKERLINLLLLLNYIGYINAKCNHNSNASIHVTPILQRYMIQKLITKIRV